MENLINEMAENVKGLKSNVENEIASLKNDIKVGRDEMQKQFDEMNAKQMKQAQIGRAHV